MNTRTHSVSVSSSPGMRTALQDKELDQLAYPLTILINFWTEVLVSSFVRLD